MKIIQMLKWLCLVAVCLGLVACGNVSTVGGGGTGVGGTGVSGSLPPAFVTVTKSIATPIAATGTVVVTANVVDIYTAAVANGTNVAFVSDLVGTTVTASALTVGGNASATFNANNVAGTATVTATAGSVSGFITISILPAATASIILTSAVPPEIGVRGGGLPETSILTFAVADAFGNPVTDGTTINFTIGTALGGGESISPATTTTVSGQATVTATSGSKAGLLGIVATEPTSGVATTGTVVVLGGKGIASNFALGTAQPSFEGYDRLNNTNDFTIVLGDIFGNAVKPGTLVTFQTEIGTIPSAATDAAGVATSTYTTLGSDPAFRSKGPSGTGITGYLTVLAMAPGQEPFFDSNNNGIYDAGDIFTLANHDFGEPFLDADEDGAFDIGEFYFDTDSNGAYSGPNGVHDATTVIWNSMVVVLSTISYSVTPVGGPPSYFVTIVDGNNNPVDYATTYAASVDTGNVTGLKSSTNVPFSFGYSLVTGSPVVPVYFPTFVNTTVTGKDDPVADLKLTVVSPSTTKVLGGL